MSAADRYFVGFGASQHAHDLSRHLTENVRKPRTVCCQPAFLGHFRPLVDRRQPQPVGMLNDRVPIRI